ncbi:natural killer cells antigen CD94 isoform 1-T1 [Dama dama]|uniref:natural killer cells antigen CD94 isoform X1 n=1 Tax=Dama dama TaxID=30532 RepID=UPI002A35C69C|nr:natural killer cells antigen CD94 isoform X1 [Dama dama]
MAGFQTTPWRLISGVLGVICLLLMAALGVLLKNSLTKQSVQLGPSTELSEGSSQRTSPEGPFSCIEPGLAIDFTYESGCYSCQEKWIGYQSNCYFISNELKTWKDSRDFCVSHNSSLLQIQTRNELDFMKFSTSYYWIGLSYSEEHHAWLWEDNSTLSQDLVHLFHTVNPKNCIMYSPSGSALDEDCESTYSYICKQQFI